MSSAVHSPTPPGNSAAIAVAIIVALLSLSRASALSSTARLAAQSRTGVGSLRHLARQSAQTALVRPLWRAVPPLARERSSRLLCSSSAREPPPPAVPDVLLPIAGHEQHVDLLPISDEWKERLRSLTRPAAIAMVQLA